LHGKSTGNGIITKFVADDVKLYMETTSAHDFILLQNAVVVVGVYRPGIGSYSCHFEKKIYCVAWPLAG